VFNGMIVKYSTGHRTPYKSGEEDKMRELAMQLAVSYCQAHNEADLLEIAEKIFQFLTKP
jgi:hypothetical protein